MSSRLGDRVERVERDIPEALRATCNHPIGVFINPKEGEVEAWQREIAECPQRELHFRGTSRSRQLPRHAPRFSCPQVVIIHTAHDFEAYPPPGIRRQPKS
jgi:ABC-type branched-subunit amino acid transport system ATPase component